MGEIQGILRLQLLLRANMLKNGQVRESIRCITISIMNPFKSKQNWFNFLLAQQFNPIFLQFTGLTAISYYAVNLLMNTTTSIDKERKPDSSFGHFTFDFLYPEDVA